MTAQALALIDQHLEVYAERSQVPAFEILDLLLDVRNAVQPATATSRDGQTTAPQNEDT